MASTLVLGSTGMTGSHILSTILCLSPSQVPSVQTISRRTPAHPASTSTNTPKLDAKVEKDTSRWEALISTPAPHIVFSALATTRAAAGGFDKQYVLEHDLNIALARKAREAGSSTYVLISASSASADSRIPYTRMKGEIERDVLAMDYAHTVILRPGLIGGRREESRPAEAVIRWLADGLGYISGGLLKDFWTQDADVIGRAAVRAGLRAQRGEMPGKSTILYGKDIIALGKEHLTEQERT